MSEVKAADSSRTARTGARGARATSCSTLGYVHELIGKLMQYEQTAGKYAPGSAPGRFRMLTGSERQFYRAELVADYIRLAVAELGGTPEYFASALGAFCAKICEMEAPSLELMGTYLAAADVVSKEDRLKSIPDLEAALRRTIIRVLRSCVALMRERTSALQAVPSSRPAPR